ncbi:MAG TPA: transposase family protein [Acidobacteriota bacterium]|nr:transposase family protein [Acidobacteriota bacterium]
MITDQKGEILDIKAGYRGPAAADVKVYEDAGIPERVADKPRLGDKGYVGAKPEVETPVKKPKGGELTEAQRESNRKLSHKRVRVEHGIRRLKAFRILRDE